MFRPNTRLIEIDFSMLGRVPKLATSEEKQDRLSRRADTGSPLVASLPPRRRLPRENSSYTCVTSGCWKKIKRGKATRVKGTRAAQEKGAREKVHNPNKCESPPLHPPLPHLLGSGYSHSPTLSSSLVQMEVSFRPQRHTPAASTLCAWSERG